MTDKHERIGAIIPEVTPDIGHKVSDDKGHTGYGHSRSEAEAALRVAQDNDVEWAEKDTRPLLGALPGHVLGSELGRADAAVEVRERPEPSSSSWSVGDLVGAISSSGDGGNLFLAPFVLLGVLAGILEGFKAGGLGGALIGALVGMMLGALLGYAAIIAIGLFLVALFFKGLYWLLSHLF